jgi:DNA-binding GntR family transcriptional regulator
MVSKQSATAVERAHIELRMRIVHGALRPGAPLREAGLARELRLSRTPVREALARLCEEGYAEKIAGSGFRVAQVTVTMIQDVFEVRSLLEGAAAARAAKRATPEDIARLREFADAHPVVDSEATNRKAFEANSRFHELLAASSRNLLLVDLVRYCSDQVTRFMALGVSLETFQQAAHAEHHAIVDAIERGDSEAARETTERHLEAAARFLLNAVMNGELRAVAV